MTQNKDKQIRELKLNLIVEKESSEGWERIWGLTCGIAWIIIIVLIIFIVFLSFDKADLKQELQSCQNKVPEDKVCERELKPICNPHEVVCKINKNRTDNLVFFVWCMDSNCSGDFEIVENCEVISE